MSRHARYGLAFLLFLLFTPSPLYAQAPGLEDRPAPFVPRQPPTREELDRHEALVLYAQAQLRQRQDRLLDAASLLEKARGLDPQACYVYRALVPLDLALCRTDDALAACRKVLDLDPGDYETWYLYARQLKNLGRADEAVSALGRAVLCAGVREYPELLASMHYDRGILYEESHDYVRAEAAYRDVTRVLDRPEVLLDTARFDPVQIKAQVAKTYESIGRVCTQSRRFGEAVAAYRKACTLDPERNGRLNYNLARVYVADKKPSEALEALNAYLRTEPQEIEAYELKVSLLKQLGRAGEVVPALKALADRDAHHLALHLLLAREYGAAGQIAEAESLYKALAQESPVPEVYHGWFELCRKNNRMGEMVALFDQAMARGTDTKERRGDRQAAAEARAMLAVLREDRAVGIAFVAGAQTVLVSGRKLEGGTNYFIAALADRAHILPEAERFYRLSLSGAPVSLDTEVKCYLGLAQVLWQERKFEDIEALCRQGLAKRHLPLQLTFHLQLANALAQQDRAEEAIKEADEAVRLASTEELQFDCRSRKVRVLAQLGQSGKAIAECQAMLKEFAKAEQTRQLRYLLSSLYSEAHRYADSEEQLRLILKEDPNDVGAQNDLGYILADQGKDLDEAERLVRRAIELDRQSRQLNKPIDGEEENYAYLDSLGWVLFRRGHFDEARTWLEEAAALDEGAIDPVIWDHLGDVYARLDQIPRARFCWDKAIVLFEKEKRRRLDDRYEEIKRKLKLLEPQP